MSETEMMEQDMTEELLTDNPEEREAGFERIPEGKEKAAIEAILFSMGDSVDAGRLAKVLGMERKETVGFLQELMQEYEESGKGVRIIELDGSYQMCTNPELYEYLIRIAKAPKHYSLSDTVLETLSIVAYKQPVTKAEIERIRGVSCDFAVNKLLEYNLITELGRLDAPGRPLLFGTTEEFLRSFGVKNLSDLPELSMTQIEEFKMQAEEEAQLKLDI